MSFLKKTNLGANAPFTKPNLLGTKKISLNTQQPKEIDIEVEKENSTDKTTTTTSVKPLLGAKKISGGLTTKPKLGIKKEIIEDPTIEDSKEESSTPEFEPTETPKIKIGEKKSAVNQANLNESEVEKTDDKETVVLKDKEEDTTIGSETPEIENKEKPLVEEEKTTKKTITKKKSSKKRTEVNESNAIEEVAIDESKRVSLSEMDTVMRQIVAPTTESWEQEKKDVLDALNNIKVEQDMTMSQVKNCLADLDELNFEILPKLHDAETMYDGTKQNYDTVKAIAIAKGSGGNAEARKAEGILACKNFVTPSGAVVDLHQYMLLIEERHKFYQKIVDGINFKKYSLVNYNNALKVESKNA